MSSIRAEKRTVIDLMSGPAVPDSGTTLHVKRRYVSLVVLTVFLLTAAQTHRVLAQQLNVRAHPPRDLAVLKNESGTYTIFVADSTEGIVRFRDVNPGKDDVEGWQLHEFETFKFKGSKVPRNPIALAVNNTSLFVADDEEDSVFAVDLKTGNTHVLLGPQVVKNPMSVAVSDDGLLAVGQDDASVLLYDLSAAAPSVQTLPGRIDNPVRLQFMPAAEKKASSLLVLDSEDNGPVMFQITQFEPTGRSEEPYTAKLIQLPKSVLSRVENRDDTTLDLAFLNDTYYLTEGRNWAVSSEVGLTSTRWVLFAGMYKVTPERLRVSGDNLFVFDSKQGQVMRLSLKPMTVRLEVNASEANGMLSELYQALYAEQKGSLPEREYIVSSPGRLAELLKLEQVFAPGNYTRTFLPLEDTNIPVSTMEQYFEFLLCKLNRHTNKWKCPPSAAEAQGLDRLKQEFGKGHTLIIPGLGVDAALYQGAVSLRGKSVEDHIKGRLLIENPHERFTTEYLMRINQNYYRTLDYELTRSGYILPSPFLSSATIGPGSLLQIVQNREQPVDCQPTWPQVAEQMRSEPLEKLTDKLRTFAPTLEYVPRKATNLSDQSVLNEWRKLGVDTLEVIFENAVEERGSRSALKEGAVPQCWLPLAQTPNTFLIADVIRVSGARFRLLKKDGHVAQLKYDDLVRWGIDAEPEDAGNWSFKVTKPYVLGYRALPWDGKALFSEKGPTTKIQAQPETELRFVSDPHVIKPGATQDVWAKTEGTFLLPGFRWEIKLLTDSLTLSEASVVRKWAARYPEMVYVWPTPGNSGGETEPNTIIAKPEPGPPAQLEPVTSNRGLLKKAIAFPEGINSDDIIVGLMERSGSVQPLNPDFAWKEIKKEDCPSPTPCEWDFVWLVPAKKKENDQEPPDPPGRLRQPVSEETKVVRSADQIPAPTEYWPANHGTHIAGLLASNNKDAPGLLPDALFCWLELGDAQKLKDQVFEQNAGALRVINVSQKFLDDGYKWIQDQLRNDNTPLISKLLVVAAGNDGFDLNTNADVKPPIEWMNEFNNILSVSATDMDHKLLFKGDGSYRVNYGVKYVDLLAPGLEIFSSTETNAYAATTGTSQAAPLVTATAAFLAKLNAGADPSLLKARLIYTADWQGRTLKERQNWDEKKHSYLERAWGGSLNAGRATFAYQQDIFLYEFGQKTLHRAIHQLYDQTKLIITNWKDEAKFVRQPRSGDRITAALKESDSKIDFGQVLRMIRLKNGLYRIIYKGNDGDLRIIMDASIEGTIKYKIFEDIENNQLGKQQATDQFSTLRMESIIDYVGGFARMGSRISFRR